MSRPANPLLHLAREPLRYALSMATYLGRGGRRDRRRPAAVHFDLSRNPFQRYLFLLAEFFTLAGFDVVFRHRTRFLAQLGRYSNLILTSPHMRLGLRAPSGAELRFTDRPQEGWTTLSADYFQPPHPSSFHVPMAMHPNMYRLGHFRRCEGLSANRERRTRVLFAGNADRALYSNGTAARVFGKLGRLEILEALEASFPQQIARGPAGDRGSPEREAAIVLCEASSCYIPQATFLDALSGCSFFIAAPGVAVPMCHNAVEAMSVGAVPVLNYAEHFHPPLQHGLNCLTFSGYEELTQSVRDALAMDGERVGALRLGALAYYHRHLRPAAVVDSVLERRSTLETLFLNAEQQSVLLLERKVAGGVPK